MENWQQVRVTMDHKEKARPAPLMTPEVQAQLDEIRKRSSQTTLHDQAKQVAREVHDHVRQSQEQLRLPGLPMPTDLCRISPFFPLNRNQLKDRPFIQERVVTRNAWGTITFTGLKLSTYEEDVLLAVLAILDDAHQREDAEHEGEPTYSYTGSARPLLQLMGYSSPNKAEYARLISSLKILSACSLELETSKGDLYVVGGIVSGVHWEPRKRRIKITINPFFRQMYAAGRVTILDAIKRIAIKSPTGKAMLRFLESHKGREWRGHFMTLAKSLNLDMEAEQKEIKRRIKSALTELKREKILHNRSRFHGDVVTIAEHGPEEIGSQ